MVDNSRFVAFVSEPARIAITAGVVTVHLRSGDQAIEIAMPVRTLNANCGRSQRALRLHAAEHENIVIDD